MTGVVIDLEKIHTGDFVVIKDAHGNRAAGRVTRSRFGDKYHMLSLFCFSSEIEFATRTWDDGWRLKPGVAEVHHDR